MAMVCSYNRALAGRRDATRIMCKTRRGAMRSGFALESESKFE